MADRQTLSPPLAGTAADAEQPSLWDRLPGWLLAVLLLPLLPAWLLFVALEYRATHELWERHDE